MQEENISATTMTTETKNWSLWFMSYARKVYLLGVVLALLFVIPASWFPLQLGKLTIFAGCLVITALLFAAGGGVKELLRGRIFPRVALVALLPLSYLLGYVYSVDRSVGLFGVGLDTDTVSFVLLGFVALLLGSCLFRTTRQLRSLVTVIFASTVVAALFQGVVVAFGVGAIPFQVFSDRSVNLIGKWNDFGLLLGMLTLWILASLERHSHSVLRRVLLLVLLAFSVVLLGLVQFPLAWWLIGAFSLLLAVVGYFSTHGAERDVSITRRVSWYAIGGVVVSVLFLISGPAINTVLSKVFPVTSLEVRPSYSATLSIVQSSHSGVQQALIGSGPNTFEQAWALYKPVEVNLSEFWSLDFSTGYSTLFTAFAGAGLLGAVSWLVPLILVLLALLRVARTQKYSLADKLSVIVVGLSAVYLWIAIVLYVPSQNLILLAFVLAGSFLGFVYGAEAPQEQWPAQSRLLRVLMCVASGLIIAVTIILAYAGGRLFMAETYTNKGILALGAGDNTAALAASVIANQYGKNGNILRFQTQVGLSQLRQLVAASSTPNLDVQRKFTELASSTIAQGQKTVSLSPRDYRSTLVLTQVYDFLSSLNVQNAYQLAQNTYASTAMQSPSNPAVPLMQARLEAAHGNKEKMQEYLTRSLTLKQNYTDAILLAVQFYVAQKDLPNAIQAGRAAVQSAPNVPSIWFELGLLYYTANDTANAIQPLEQAIHLQANYANAKYFLGLSYYAEGKTSEAISMFKDLQTTNQDNQEVALILSNMEAGKPAFTSAKPPITTPPEKRATAPVSE